MSKYTWIFIIFFVLVFTTYLVDLTGLTASVSTGADIMAPTTSSSVTIWSMLATYINIMGFRVQGLPAIVNLLIFYPLSAILLYLLAEIIKDIIPFT